MMKHLLFNHLSVIWLLLVGATILSVECVGVIFPRTSSNIVAASVIAIAYLKMRFVGLDFMELRHAPILARISFEVWLVIICAAIISVRWLGIAV
jgi:hypothetical protein